VDNLPELLGKQEERAKEEEEEDSDCGKKEQDPR